MLKLHGAPLSNYYNMVKTALLEKDEPFEAVLAPPSQEADFLAKSPMGKIPTLETEDGFISETLVILDYLEDRFPQTPLLPEDAYARAKAREIAHALALYVELVGRRGYGFLRGKPVAEEIKDSMRADLPKGVAAIAKLAQFSPWIAGDTFTYADLVGYFTMTYANTSAKGNIELDMLDQIPGAKQWFEKVGARASVVQALADQG